MKSGPKPRPKTPKLTGNLSTIPPAPEYFSDDAVCMWHTVCADLVKRGILSAADLPMVEAYVFEARLAEKAARDIQKRGSSFVNKNGAEQRNPSLLIRSKAIENLIKLSKSLGLSPYGRQRTDAGAILPDTIESIRGDINAELDMETALRKGDESAIREIWLSAGGSMTEWMRKRDEVLDNLYRAFDIDRPHDPRKDKFKDIL